MQNNNDDLLAMVRKSRLEMSHREGNDPVRVIAALRRQQTKYEAQIEKCRGAFPVMAAEAKASYAK